MDTCSPRGVSTHVYDCASLKNIAQRQRLADYDRNDRKCAFAITILRILVAGLVLVSAEKSETRRLETKIKIKTRQFETKTKTKTKQAGLETGLETKTSLETYNTALNSALNLTLLCTNF